MDRHVGLGVSAKETRVCVADETGASVALPSTSPEREDTILVRDPFAD